MAFDRMNLSVLSYANGFTLWHYTTTDTAATANATDYFNAAVASLRVGDMILANVDTSDAPSALIFVVGSNTDNAVGVFNLTPIGSGRGNRAAIAVSAQPSPVPSDDHPVPSLYDFPTSFALPEE